MTHATPAALYAHTANRDWECLIPENVPNDSGGRANDLAWQLVNTAPGNRTKVIMGGGFPAFYPRPDSIPRKTMKQVKTFAHDVLYSKDLCTTVGTTRITVLQNVHIFS